MTQDLNLLTVFSVLMRCRNTSIASKELHLSQPAVSHALARLRLMFNDELFVRLPRGISPTPFAIRIAPKIDEALAKISEVFEDEDAFSPRTLEKTFSIASTELVEHLIFGDLIQTFGDAAPKARLRSLHANGVLPKYEMETGLVDLAIAGFFGNLPEGFYSQHLFEDDFVCVSRVKHPRIKKTITLDQYCNEKHLLVSLTGDFKGIVDTILEKRGKKRKIVAGLSNFLTPFHFVAESDLLLTIPRRLAKKFQNMSAIAVHEVPFESPRINVVQVWHGRNHQDPAHKWFRGLVKGCFS